MSDGEGAQSGADDSTQGGAGDTTTETGNNAGGTDSGTQSGANSDGKSARETELEALLEQQREHKRKADQRADQFASELKQLREKDMPAAEKMQRDLTEAQATVEKLKTTNQQLALQVAFLKDNSVTWHSPERALKLVDLSQVSISDDGEVTGMRDALTALAKSDPYLVKTETTTTATPPPGTSPANNGTSSTGKPNAAKLAGRFPVMRTRIKPQ